LGFASDKHFELLQHIRSQGFTDEDLLQASLAKRTANGDIYAFFRNRITFPIYDVMKNVVGFTARTLNPDDQPKYLNSAEHKAFEKSKILYGLSHAKPHINEFQKLIVVEGQMDVIGLTRLGFPLGVATSGTSLTDEHIKILKRYTENLYLLFDNDKAGQQATFRAMRLCYHQNIFPKVLTLPETVKDIDDVANLENGKQLFETCLTNAQDGFLVLFERLRNTSDMTSPIDKQKLINATFELIIAVSNVTIQEHYKTLLAEKL
jgi:DNA primase